MSGREHMTCQLERLDEEALATWRAGDSGRALELWDRLLDASPYGEQHRYRLERNRRFAIAALEDELSEYPFDTVREVAGLVEDRSHSPARLPATGVTLAILSCKRYPLFVATVSSFLRACVDRERITRWLCVDDGSHPNELAAMQALFPFFELVRKPPGQAGHARSLNLLQRLVDTPFVLALEDDWLFARPMDYIGRCLAVFDREPATLRQVLFNRHYAEGLDDAYLAQRGGAPRCDAAGRRYLLHEYRPEGADPAYEEAAAWPHFALRPSLLRTSAWREVGAFDEGTEGHFERDYALRYAARGLTSAYLDGIYTVHIGRWNRARHDPAAPPNAYQLNDQPQYGRAWPWRAAEPEKRPGERLALSVSVGEDLDAFLRRLSAVLSRCRDLALVDSLLAVDDGASPARREAIVRAFPFVRPIAVLTRGALERELAAHDFVIDLGDSVPRGPFTLGDAVRALRQRQAQSTGVAAAPWPG